MRAERPLLALILLLAAGLRFAGIAHHVVRGAADFDEQNNFLRPIERMARERTLDPTVYQGYPGLFNWIAAGPVLLGDRLGGYTGAAVGARATVAAFGVMNVLLAFVVARRLSGSWGGLFAAALLAVSRLDVRAAHHVTPDVLGATGLLVVLWLVAAQRPRAPWDDLVLGGVTGLATAVKYTGLLAGVPAAAAAFLGGGSAWLRRGLRMALAAALAFALAAPYAVGALLERGGQVTGLRHYYGEKAARNQEARGGESGFRQATRGLAGAAGHGGLLLAAAALVLSRPRRAVVPAAVAVLASLLILAPAAFVYPRHLVPPGTAVAVLAGAGLGAALGRGGALAWAGAATAALSLVLAAPPTVALVAKYRAPSAVDRAADWVETHVEGQALLLSAIPRFAIDPERFEVRRATRLQDEPRVAAGQYDLLVTNLTSDAEALAGFPTLARFPSEDGIPERWVSVLGPPPDRPLLTAIAATRAERARDALAVFLDPPARVFRVEVESTAEWPREVGVDVQVVPAGEWMQATALAIRPTDKDRRRRGAPDGQIYLLAGDEIAALRLSSRRAGDWTGAAVRLFALSAAAPAIGAHELSAREEPGRRRRRRR
ncbi:MAG TPA: glycosyltransferase family 39 protein [Vicinamibacteria bacterium]|nr:glycosyltransferase family 39 protein [Vicinamibacteria bacterium]